MLVRCVISIREKKYIIDLFESKYRTGGFGVYLLREIVNFWFCMCKGKTIFNAKSGEWKMLILAEGLQTLHLDGSN